MFRWYRNADRCYVYLSDVPCCNHQEENVDSQWELAFRESKWFTRGWTLQELLAPDIVEFFSENGDRLGDKKSLDQSIHKATKVPSLALRGKPLSHFSVDERLSWINHRHTKHEEDKAYSMLGILNVIMSPFYGEGLPRASQRLMDEIDKKRRCAVDLRATDPRDDKNRIESTKGGLLENSYRWILEHTDFKKWRNDSRRRLLWIKGDPGKGKTMLLCGISDELERSTSGILSFFFCQATDSRINSATAILRGLIYLIFSQQPSLIIHLRRRYDEAGPTLFQDANAWFVLSNVFRAIVQDPEMQSAYLVVDALDECLTDLPKFLDLVIDISATSGKVKWLLSSRNELHIEQKLKSMSEDARLSLELKGNAEKVSCAVETYIKDRLSRLESLEDNNLRAQSGTNPARKSERYIPLGGPHHSGA